MGLFREGSDIVPSSPTESTPLVSSSSEASSSPSEKHLPLSSVLHPTNTVPSIGFWSSVAIAVNNLTGPGMLDLPACFQKAGLFPTSICIVVVSYVSSTTSLALSNVIARQIPDRPFSKPIEYSDAFRHNLGERWFKVTQVLFFLCVMSQAVASIVSTAQVVDAFIANIFGATYGFQPFFLFEMEMVKKDRVALAMWSPGQCDHHHRIHDCLPFSSHHYSSFVLSLGYAITAIILVPLSLMDMKENAASQKLSFFLLLVFLAEFVGSFYYNGFDPDYNFSMWGHTYKELIGVVLFNFALTPTVPAWLHEKSDDTSVPKVIWGSNALVIVLYIVVGSTGAMSIHEIPDNFLAYLSAGHQGSTTQMCANLFSFFIIGFGIPLFMIIMRYNLVNSGLVGDKTGMFLTSVLPWILSWLLYQGEGIVNIFA